MAAPLDPRLIKRATATRGFLVAVALTGIVNALCVIAQAWLTATAASGVFYSESTVFPGPLPSLWAYIGALGVVFALRAALNWINPWLAHRASVSVKSQLRSDLLSARLTKPLDSAQSSSTLIHLATQGLDALDGYFSKYLPQLVMAASIPIVMLVVVAFQDIQAAIIIAITLPLIPLFMALVGITTRDQVNRRLRSQTRLSNHFSDLVAGLPTLQVFGRARSQLKGLRITETKSRTETMATLRLAFVSGGVLELLATLSVALVAVSVGFRVLDGGLDLNTSLFILVLAPEIYLPVRLVGVHFHDSADGTAAADAVFRIIDESEQSDDSPMAAPPSLESHNIVFSQVSVRYPGADLPSVENLSFTIHPGEVVALVGPSGGGKSTILSVLMGFIAPTSGSVSIGGIDLQDMDHDAWRRQIAWVGQNPGILRGTIASNLLIGDPQASQEKLREVLDRAGGQSLSLEREIADDGEGLSAGERRRVALARALLRIDRGEARMLILDEPTAGLDQATEAQAVAAVQSAGVGAVVVSHREALLTLADDMVAVGSDASPHSLSESHAEVSDAPHA